MPLSYDKIIQGSMFRFLVGQEQKLMTIHTAVVAEQSTALRKLVEGSMKETQDGTATWDDVDEDIFALFAQFAYTGDYNPLSCNLIEANPPIPSGGLSDGKPQPSGLVDSLRAVLEDESPITGRTALKKPKKLAGSIFKHESFAGRYSFRDLNYATSAPNGLEDCASHARTRVLPKISLQFF
ncbi:hypothetical protein MMC09_002263 [Bachmanniomyces sp. S44760]|nr:hypothetical protein [Bachmanniomyces sp. S44760]